MTDISTHHQPKLSSDDPLDAQLTFDDMTMLGFAAVAVIGAVVLLAFGF